jgi:hypothetical protein
MTDDTYNNPDGWCFIVVVGHRACVSLHAAATRHTAMRRTQLASNYSSSTTLAGVVGGCGGGAQRTGYVYKYYSLHRARGPPATRDDNRRKPPPAARSPPPRRATCCARILRLARTQIVARKSIAVARGAARLTPPTPAWVAATHIQPPAICGVRGAHERLWSRKWRGAWRERATGGRHCTHALRCSWALSRATAGRMQHPRGQSWPSRAGSHGGKVWPRGSAYTRVHPCELSALPLT